MNRAEKKQFVETLGENLKGVNSLVIAHYHGLTVEQISNLRGKVRESGSVFKVVKNRLAKLAFADTDFADLAEKMKGPTAICYSEDSLSPAKILSEFANDNKSLKLVGGIYDGRILDKAGVEELAKIPSLDESRAKIIGVLQAPAQKLLAVINSPAGQLTRVFGAYGNKK